MKHQLKQFCLVASVAGIQCSCATKQHELNLSEYPNFPSAPITHAMRAVVNSNNYMRTRALWGNYGGPGSIGGPPTDAMDEYFRQHDLAYLQGITRADLEDADALLISQLEALDASQLSPRADKFRLGAIGYFNGPISRVLGKPPDVIFGCKDKPAVIDTSPAN